jgi:squalene cyclase
LLGLAGQGALRARFDGTHNLLAEQRRDGGWAHPITPSDAYATGQALVALAESGGVATHDRAYAQGVKFLLSTQLEDGSWFVRTRVPIQPH